MSSVGSKDTLSFVVKRMYPAGKITKRITDYRFSTLFIQSIYEKTTFAQAGEYQFWNLGE